MTPQPATYPRHRFPAEIISRAVWLYHVFSLSLRDIELILAERGVGVTQRRGRNPREYPTLVPEVRRRLRKEAVPAAAQARGYMASR